MYCREMLCCCRDLYLVFVLMHVFIHVLLMTVVRTCYGELVFSICVDFARRLEHSCASDACVHTCIVDNCGTNMLSVFVLM